MLKILYWAVITSIGKMAFMNRIDIDNKLQFVYYKMHKKSEHFDVWNQFVWKYSPETLAGYIHFLTRNVNENLEEDKQRGNTY